MRILHTADWHIGKVLHKHSLVEEQTLFLNWLLQIIKSESIDVLLISGDIFDLANPSVKDRSVYYQFLKKLIGTDIRIIITGGNHDSVGVLNGPREILEMLNVTVIGGATPDIEDELIEIKNNKGEIELVVAAVPFLRDRDLRTLSSDKKFDKREDAISAGIRIHYAKLAEICLERYPDLPIIAMGHLYARGVTISDSEREIHVGNAAAVTSDVFPDVFNYVALGHIHKPQVINSNPMIRYSGSPVALSFSEKEDNKLVLIIECKNGKLGEPLIHNVPRERELKKFSGTLNEVQQKVEEYKNEFNLPAFIELDIKEKIRDVNIISQADDYVFKYIDKDNFRILKHRIEFEQKDLNTADLFREGVEIEDLKISDVFDKKMEAAAKSEEDKEMLMEIFKELIDMYNEKDQG
jgi:DNA repair protein SbcD/Mre11